MLCQDAEREVNASMSYVVIGPLGLFNAERMIASKPASGILTNVGIITRHKY